MRGPALRRAGLRVPAFELSRSNMFHVLRHTCASVRLEAGESVVSLSTWLEQGHQHEIPQKSPLAGWTTPRTINPQVKDMISVAGNVQVKYKETARGGLAVNVIEC